MSDIKDGGPAFPVFPETGGGHALAFQGMTLRDYFAAKAMQAIISNPNCPLPDAKIAQVSYSVADAMLKARDE